MIYENKYQIGDLVKSTLSETKTGEVKIVVEGTTDGVARYSYWIFNKDDNRYYCESENYLKLVKSTPEDDSDSVKVLRQIIESSRYESDLKVGDIVRLRDGLIGEYVVASVTETAHGEEVWQYELIPTAKTRTDETYLCRRLLLEYQYHDKSWEKKLSENETFFEMAMIAYEEKLNISVNQETKHLSIAYFKIYDHQKYSAAKRVARLHFKDSGMEYHDDSRGKVIWELNGDVSDKVVKLMQSPNDEHEGYTNWQVACYQWNYNNGLVKNFKDYFAGKYDHMYDNDTRLQKAYVPHDQKMPDGWIYDKSKGKGHK